MSRFFSTKTIIAVFAALGFVPCFTAAQEPAAQRSASQPTIRKSAEEVLLDVVVRDKKGRLINDLKPEDFQVSDNGQPEKITSFRLVQGGEAVAQGGTRTTLDPLRQVRLITLIFQCWSSDARRLAHDGALDLLKGELPQNVYISVMTIDHKLQVLQSFTNDPVLIRKAIERATHSQGADFSADTARVQKELEDMLGPKTSADQSSEHQLSDQQSALSSQTMANRGADGAGFANLAMARMVLTMIQTERDTAMQEWGRADIYGLLDCVKEQYQLPGRKTILYLREGGFPIP
ncbi:MAG TPA: VWA domain-containing protein, partial [Candidatus Dormibacteraeota bacterium]|nr:VWA domain-containing protein [Candidatus Dormibacteraeota bacterium]